MGIEDDFILKSNCYNFKYSFTNKDKAKAVPRNFIFSSRLIGYYSILSSYFWCVIDPALSCLFITRGGQTGVSIETQFQHRHQGF